ncbi:MAG: 50S ribosomal protein L30 [Bacteroidota bacterium]|jgi:large subunit ribosomal protein L30
MAQVKVTLTKSFIKRNVRQRATVQALGLKKLHHSVVKDVNPQIQGMIDAVAHLLKVENV